MIGWLRFVGLINAAAWFGAAVFFTFAAGPLSSSTALRELLSGARDPAYFSEAIGQLIRDRYLDVSIACGIVALLHLGAEWLYFGRAPRRFWLFLVLALFCLNLLEARWMAPRLGRLNKIAHATNLAANQKEPAAASLRAWRGLLSGIDLVVFCALGVYVWRMANPVDTTRFVSASKFRG